MRWWKGKPKEMDKFRNTYRIESARLKNWDYGRNAWYYVTICTGEKKCFFGDITDGKMKYTQAGNIARQLWMEIPNQFGYANLDEYIVMPNHIHGIIRINKTNFKQKPDGNDLYACDAGDGNDRDAGDGNDRDKGDGNDRDTGDGNDRDTGNGNDRDAGDGNDRDAGDGRDAINRVSTVDTVDPTTDVPTNNSTTIDTPDTKNPTTNDRGGITGNKNPMVHDNLSRIIRWYKGRVTFETRKILTAFTWQSRFHDRIIWNEDQLIRVKNYIINNPRNWENDKLKII